MALGFINGLLVGSGAAPGQLLGDLLHLRAGGLDLNGLVGGGRRRRSPGLLRGFLEDRGRLGLLAGLGAAAAAADARREGEHGQRRNDSKGTIAHCHSSCYPDRADQSSNRTLRSSPTLQSSVPAGPRSAAAPLRRE